MASQVEGGIMMTEPLTDITSSIDDPYLTETLLSSDNPNVSEMRCTLEGECTTFCHPYPSPVPNPVEQQATDDLLSVCLRDVLSDRLTSWNTNAKQLFYYQDHQDNPIAGARFIRRTLLFAFTRLYDKKQEFRSRDLESQAKIFLGDWFDGDDMWGKHRVFPRSIDKSVFVAVAVGTRMRLWKCSKVADAANGVDITPLWGGVKEGDWGEYLEIGDSVEGVWLRNEIVKMLLGAGEMVR
ncbi:uncharacterized protein LY89DRAFT_713783 [Mollisia scopiformis]|uniref:Uncharacterized protein n=1 Tax=Mollisia scopiformis TaxID=149040 RepID=A0A194XT19_MOLSC|nr:uncharacterized protein LY89DRAFT_713783 [Mollisia scopiformis]KUJ23291.1 hypothetical protein LY89DRAFT_713783 [Mollisia scopiformis]